MTDSQQLLAQYVADASEAAFRELVARYVDLVYSAAIRLVNGDAHLAEDIAQTVFVDLARMARTLPGEVMLGGWLHRHTCFVASKTLRGERRRQARERQAVEMNAMDDHSGENLARLTPLLDDAINQLEPEDRAAIMARFFERNNFQAVGAQLGTSDEAARKRVDRALDKLESLLKRRGVAFSAAALGAALSAQGVTAAPAGLAASIATAAIASISTTGTSLTLFKIMSMSKLKVGIVSAMVVAGVAVPWVMHQQSQRDLRAANEQLAQQARQISVLTSENEKLARAKKPGPAVITSPKGTPTATELSLRDKLARAELEKTEAAAVLAKANGPSALSGVKANPEMWKMIRDQQKMGMTMIYKGLTNRVTLGTNQVEQLNDLHADNVMDNIDRITEVLRAKMTPEQAEMVFAGQEAVLLDKVRAIIGSEAMAQYEDYTQKILSVLTVEQFKGSMSGDKAAKEETGKQLLQLMLDETQSALSAAGLPANYQTVPTLNFRNFAFESVGDKNLKLLEDIYRRVAERATFLNEKDAAKFKEFSAAAINGNKMGLMLNRKMMAPGSN
jgi:RNA polymerase sigma factor (sigma-70 family)